MDEDNHPSQPSAGVPHNVVDPVCQMSITDESPFTAEHDGNSYYFCSQACEQRFRASPDRYIQPKASPEHGTAAE